MTSTERWEQWQELFFLAMRQCHPEPWKVADWKERAGWRTTLHTDTRLQNGNAKIRGVVS